MFSYVYAFNFSKDDGGLKTNFSSSALYTYSEYVFVSSVCKNLYANDSSNNKKKL